MRKGAERFGDLPRLDGVRYRRLVRDRPGHMVCEIRLHGRPAYLKLFRHAGAARTVRETQGRLEQAASALGQIRDAVALPLLALPEQGILVLEAAPGAPLAATLARADAGARAELLGRIGGWLGRLGAPTRQRGSFGPRFWLGLTQDRIDGAAGDWIDRDLVAAQIAQMRSEAALLRGASVQRAVLHGDLTPENLYWQPKTARLTGIDIQGAAVIPVALDMARLLAWLESRRGDPAPDTIDGIASADYRALVQTPGLLAEDQRPILRFLLGVMFLAYYLYCPRQPQRRRLLGAAMQDWIRQAPPQM